MNIFSIGYGCTQINKQPYRTYSLKNSVIVSMDDIEKAQIMIIQDLILQEKSDNGQFGRRIKEVEGKIKVQKLSLNEIGGFLSANEESAIDFFLRGRAPTLYNPVTYKTHFDTWKKGTLKEILSKLP